MCHSRTTPVNVSTARMNASSIAPLWVIISSRRLGIRSTTTPPQGVTISEGMAEAKPTMPSMRSEWLSCHTSQPCATVCIQVPAFEMSCPPKYSW